MSKEKMKEPKEDISSDRKISTIKNESKESKLSGSQKAAAVIVSLGVDKASQLYKFMETDDVERLTLEVAQMGILNSAQTENVLNEYNQMCLTNKAVTEGGLEYARTVLEKAFGDQTAEKLLQRVTKSIKSQNLFFLNKIDTKLLFSMLQQERAQTIALVLSYVDPAKSAAIIELLEPEKQTKVIKKIAEMTGASPDAVKLIEAQLSKQLTSMQISSDISVGGVDYAASVMNNLDSGSEKAIFDSLQQYDPKLTDEIRKRMFIFDDIVTMDDRSVQRFIRDCDAKDLVLSLKAAKQDVADKLFKNMSERMAENIRDDLAVTNNVRLRDVEIAQQNIVSIIRDLEEKNEIIILKEGRDDIIA